MITPNRARRFNRGLASLLATLLPVFSMAAELKTHDQWIAAAPPNATTLAAYICFINDGDKDVEITGVSAKGYGMAMIHKTMNHGDMVMMEEAPTLLVPAHKMLTLEPGATHIMLMDPEKVPAIGDRVPLTVQYRDGSKQTFMLEVRVPVANIAADKKSAAKHPHHQ